MSTDRIAWDAEINSKLIQLQIYKNIIIGGKKAKLWSSWKISKFPIDETLSNTANSGVEQRRIKEREKQIVLVEIALEATGPFGLRAGDGESGEEFREGTRRRGPVHFSQRLHQILSRHVTPIHRRLIGKFANPEDRGQENLGGKGGKRKKMKKDSDCRW